MELAGGLGSSFVSRLLALCVLVEVVDKLMTYGVLPKYMQAGIHHFLSVYYSSNSACTEGVLAE